jgi:HlyD family secretion protein
LLLIALVGWGLWPRPVPVEVAEVRVGPLRVTVDEEGETRIRERYVISAPVTGRLRRIELDAGDPVREGETILATIDPVLPPMLDERSRSSAQARLDAAIANLEKARAAHAFATSELRRFERLGKEGAVSAQDLEMAEWRSASATKELAAAESNVRAAKAELAESTGVAVRADANNEREPVLVTAPASGRVLRVLEESQRPVMMGTPLLEIGDPSELEVIIEVLSQDGARISVGAPVILEEWGGPVPLEARVRLVEPAAFTKISALGVEEQRVRVVADLVTPLEDRPGLGDQFRVEAKVVIWQASQVLQVPSGALFRRGNEWAAFLVAGGRARERVVEVGRSSGTEVVVEAGLAAGDKVILYPGDRVRDGLRVVETAF